MVKEGQRQPSTGNGPLTSPYLRAIGRRPSSCPTGTYVSTHGFTPFVIHRVLFGVLINGLVAAGALAPGAGDVG